MTSPPPEILSTGDVMRLFGFTYDRVRNLRRSGRLESEQEWYATNHYYWPEAVQRFADSVGREVDWSRLTD